MNRDALGPVLIALLAVLALGVGAAALDSSSSPSGDVGGGGGTTGLGEGSTFDLGRPVPSDVSGDVPTIPPVVFQLLAAALVVAFLLSLYHLRDELGLRHLGLVAVLSVALAGLLAGLVLLIRLLGGDGSPGRGGLLGERARTLPGGGGGGSADGATQTFATDPPLLAIALGAVLLLGVALALRSSGDETDDTEPIPNPATDVAAIGRAAGRSADRIAGESSVENEVYRAWREMTTHLGVERPQSSTPGEFARAATRAGMAHEDVTELTDLFRAVRYGGSAVTDDRETRAVAALRRIEREYADASETPP